MLRAGKFLICIFLMTISIFVFAEENKIKNNDEKSEPSFRAPLREIRPGGDFSRLKYTIRMNRERKYWLGEPVLIGCFVFNDSDSHVYISSDSPTNLFSADNVQVTDAERKDVALTEYGKNCIEWWNNHSDWPIFLRENWKTFQAYIGIYDPKKDRVSKGLFVVEPKQERMLTELKPIPLNAYFDISKPGFYKVTFYRKAFCNEFIYDQPLQSNTLTFEISEQPITLDILQNSGEFIFPPLEPNVSRKPQITEKK
ncbi:MAG: hypothetical protein LBQ54_11590 [Planctomycetaceae bacterium]|jgi:hypothetical protein|nr:hypothetical protein [Planctomycetaceae bacterium]